MLRETAEALHKDALRVQRTALIHANSSFMPMLCALAASFWIESYDESEWLQLSQLASSEYEKALIELLQGQLLMSRKLAGAHQRLNSAFMRRATISMLLDISRC
ncbi:hypothetical protein [Candidatus Reidiella endopervernicosa]|uniref:Uncharacterized protein n=1 Tax=Candidatus Reidiella endopervernicosa TaxID=2738883 RepID=A0A6N0HSG7_9GAMM|nr:hypothetical protein [Candidatus Reidiella endopervernicosa]QKQ25274.1 hypothetical protein HUE57_02445 [Candidatus Reidiella endopervernicosa]